ncbi:hypothetical protein KKA15_06000 [Patescibacteria group bacterium]|nr:hypothetical protein [Patescibacteria group bacterium]
MEPKLIIIGFVLVIIIVASSSWVLIKSVMPTTIPYFSCQLDTDCPTSEKCQANKCISVGCIGIGGTIPGAISPQYREHMSVQCCPGLIQIDWPSNYDTDCNLRQLAGAPAGTCTNCGDGNCTGMETKCNCPFDCR